MCVRIIRHSICIVRWDKVLFHLPADRAARVLLLGPSGHGLLFSENRTEKQMVISLFLKLCERVK